MPPPLTQGQHPFGDKAKEQELLEQQKRVRRGHPWVLGGHPRVRGAPLGDREHPRLRRGHPWVLGHPRVLGGTPG